MIDMVSFGIRSANNRGVNEQFISIREVCGMASSIVISMVVNVGKHKKNVFNLCPAGLTTNTRRYRTLCQIIDYRHRVHYLYVLIFVSSA